MKTKHIVIHVALPMLVALWPVHAAQAQGTQSLDEQVRSMRAEIEELRKEVEALRGELHGQAPSADAGEPTPAEILPVLQAEVREHAQTKVETSSKFPMKVFGSIISNTVWNSGTPDWPDIPNIAGTHTPGQPQGSFTSTLRQSRLGALLDGPTIGSLKASAMISFDFYGGISNFSTAQTMGLPRLTYAYARLENDRTAFEVGQDQMILAPKNPTSLADQAFPMMYRSGNLYLKVPQIRGERVLASGRLGEVRAVGGIIAPIAGDLFQSFDFELPVGAGELSRTPGVQARLSWKAPNWEFGASSHYSRQRYATGITPSWASAFDFDATAGRFGTGGEFFIGRNINAFGGSIAQMAKSRGGFVEGRLAATRRLSLNGGYGTDRLYDLLRFPAPLAKNSSAFANTIYQFTPEFATSLEFRWLGTRALIPDNRRNNQINLTFAYSF